MLVKQKVQLIVNVFFFEQNDSLDTWNNSIL